jgi:hypothetical protein
MTSGGITVVGHFTKSRVIILPLKRGERKCLGKKCISFAHMKMFDKDVLKNPLLIIGM